MPTFSNQVIVKLFLLSLIFCPTLQRFLRINSRHARASKSHHFLNLNQKRSTAINVSGTIILKLFFKTTNSISLLLVRPYEASYRTWKISQYRYGCTVYGLDCLFVRSFKLRMRCGLFGLVWWFGLVCDVGWLVGWLVNRSSYAVRSNPQTVSDTFAAWSLPVIHPFAQPNFKAITPCDH